MSDSKLLGPESASQVFYPNENMKPREFAVEIVQKLQHAGFQGLWAGGCVRDQLMGYKPKDYDVATSALPDEVQRLFGKKRTLSVGVSFGVITVLGPKSAGQIEVATFRRDRGYSDGRRPDSVEYTDAREDAMRRDFTINGMFFDPINQQVIDFVGGQEDLEARRIRAIGNPHERIKEDKLRMLRGIRFAATFDFELERETMAAIKKHAPEITVVSGERIGAEMHRMLASRNRAVAARMLRESGLLTEILPGGSALYDDKSRWEETLKSLGKLSSVDFEPAAAILLEPIIASQGITEVANRWKLSNANRKSINWICQNWKTLARADQLKWSQIQPLLVTTDVTNALAVAEARQTSTSDGVVFCRERLAESPQKLDPKPLLDGDDLIRLGFERGPLFKSILESVRIAQLDGEIETPEQAEQIARGYSK